MNDHVASLSGCSAEDWLTHTDALVKADIKLSHEDMQSFVSVVSLIEPGFATELATQIKGRINPGATDDTIEKLKGLAQKFREFSRRPEEEYKKQAHQAAIKLKQIIRKSADIPANIRKQLNKGEELLKEGTTPKQVEEFLLSPYFRLAQSADKTGLLREAIEDLVTHYEDKPEFARLVEEIRYLIAWDEPILLRGIRQLKNQNQPRWDPMGTLPLVRQYSLQELLCAIPQDSKDPMRKLRAFFKMVPTRQAMMVDMGLTFQQMEALEEKTPRDESDKDRAESFVVRKKDWQSTFQYDERSDGQVEYGANMSHGVRLATAFCEQGASGHKVMALLCSHRQAVAKGQEDAKKYPTDQWENFGSLRDTAGRTYCGGVYSTITAHYKDRYALAEEVFGADHKQATHAWTSGQMGHELINWNLGFVELTQTLPTTGQDIRLNVLGINLDRKGDDLQESGISAIHHCCEKHVEVLEYAEQLFDEAVAEDTPKEKAKEKMVRAFWWICQAKPWRRGDPSIAEMFMKTAFEIKGIEIRPWKLGIIPWVEVMNRPLEEFVATFDELLD